MNLFMDPASISKKRSLNLENLISNLPAIQKYLTKEIIENFPRSNVTAVEGKCDFLGLEFDCSAVVIDRINSRTSI